ncbi:MAG TPA: hypothetical protein VF603_06125 [Allosphingosinicella sp.]|jgi:hypothetical protein
MSMRRLLCAGALAAALFAAGPGFAQSGPPADGGDDELAGEAAPEGASEAQPASPRRRGGRQAVAHPRAEIRPYVEVNAGISADLSGGDDDVLTYTSVAAGVDGRVETRRVTAQASYRYERSIAIDGEVGDEDSHSGVAMVHAQIAPGLSLDAGALAARGGGGAALAGPGRQSSGQVFSAYAGPTLSTQAGPLEVNAAYRLGYVHVDDDGLAGGSGGEFGDAVVHNASASVGMGPGRLPVGWTVGGGYVREESGGDFDNRFEAAYVRGDVVFPVGPTLALTAGIGYEDISSSQSDVLRDSNGAPVLIGGRFVADPTRPRLRGFSNSGLIYDGGIIWRPTPRTELQARAGHRNGGTAVTGSLRHQLPRGLGLSAQVYDTVGTTSTHIVNNLNALPTEFNANRNPLTGAFDGCVFGRDPGTGICFDQALQALSNSSFHARGANVLLSGTRGPWSFGLGAGYAHRSYSALFEGDITAFDPLSDQSFVVNAGVSRRLGRFSSMSIDAVASWFDSDRAAFEPVFSTGVTAGYYRSFLIPGLQLNAALGISHTNSGLLDSTILQALIGLRYTF